MNSASRHTAYRPRLTVDIGPLLEDQWTGIPVFTARLIRALQRHGGAALMFCHQHLRIAAEPVLDAIHASSGTLLRDGIHRGLACEDARFDPASLLLFPSKKSQTLAAREASTVHDLSTLLMPECHLRDNVDFHLRGMQRELQSNDTVFCASEFTRAALHSHFPSVRSKTRLIHQYVDWPESFAELHRNLPPLRLGRYAVVIGTVEPRKNLTLLLRALHHPTLAHDELRFVVLGRPGWKMDEQLRDMTEAQRSRMVFTGYVSEFAKYRLLLGAEFLVYPSVYEGFGIPALEAMTLGKPVLASCSSSLPEIVDDAGVFFDPFSVDDFLTALQRIQRPRTLNALRTKSLRRAEFFTWQRMAGSVMDWVCA